MSDTNLELALAQLGDDGVILGNHIINSEPKDDFGKAIAKLCEARWMTATQIHHALNVYIQSSVSPEAYAALRADKRFYRILASPAA